jgi:penicillin-binding protein 1C
VQAEVDPASAWLTLKALLEVARPGDEASWRSFATSRRIAWKTGTSWGLRDAWAVGNTSRYTVGVWVGNADGEGKPGLTGSVAAAPIMFALMERLEPSEWFVEPTLWMKEVQVCRNDGYLANGACDSRAELIPKSSHFDRISPYNQEVHLDAQRRYRVDSSCERIDRMRHENWFVLPPGPEFYFKRQHASYRSLPPYRSDCAGAASAAQSPMEFLYPNLGTRLYIPIDFNTQRGRTVFEAVHRDPNAVLHWHLDDRYVGETRVFHQQALDISAGPHVVTVVDDAGHRLSRRFEVLDKGASPPPLDRRRTQHEEHIEQVR